MRESRKRWARTEEKGKSSRAATVAGARNVGFCPVFGGGQARCDAGDRHDQDEIDLRSGAARVSCEEVGWDELWGSGGLCRSTASSRRLFNSWGRFLVLPSVEDSAAYQNHERLAASCVCLRARGRKP